MNSESHYLHRVEQSNYFQASDDIFDACLDCGCAIIPGEFIAETDDGQLIHQSCLESAMENPN